MKALVLFHSQQHGNTGIMAEAVADGLISEGFQVTLHNSNETRFPIEKYPRYDCVAFGSPDYYSYLAGTIKTFLDDWYIYRNLPGFQNKPYVIFYSHGGGGRIRQVLNLFNRIGTQVGMSIESYGKPNQKILDECKVLGIKLAKEIK